jgi:hypothetical protein
VPNATDRTAATDAQPALAYLRAAQALSDDEIRAAVQTSPELGHAADVLELAELAADHSQVQHRLRTAPAAAVEAVQAIRTGERPDAAGLHTARVLLLATGAPDTAALLPEVDAAWATEAERGEQPPAADPEVPPALGAGDALTLMQRLIVCAQREPLNAIGDGRLAMADASDIGTLADADPGTVRSLTGLLHRSGLLRRVERRFEVAAAAADWLGDADPGRRWLAVARGARPDGPLRELLATWHGTAFADLAASAHAAWPFGADWLRPELRQLRDDWAAIGALDADQTLTPAGRALLAGQTPPVAWAPPAGNAYLQDDLRIVVPGVSAPPMAEFLSWVARPLALAQAETYEVTAETVASAHAHELEAADILRRFEEMSTTGVPQPLRYLVNDTIAAMGRIVVTPALGGTDLRCQTPTLAETLLVDQRLRLLALVRRSETELFTRSPLPAVMGALSEARHPASADIPEPPNAAAPSAAAEPAPADRDEPAADLTHLLQPPPRERLVSWAIKHHAALEARVTMPGGKVQTFVLHPRSISHNRLRAADPGTETERTLPLSAIDALRIEGDRWDR